MTSQTAFIESTFILDSDAHVVVEIRSVRYANGTVAETRRIDSDVIPTAEFEILANSYSIIDSNKVLTGLATRQATQQLLRTAFSHWSPTARAELEPKGE